MPVPNVPQLVSEVINFLQGSLPILGPLLGALLGAYAGAYLQRKFEERNRIRQEIHRPLYNELSKASEGNLPFNHVENKYRSIWSDFDPFKKIQLTDNIVDSLNEYEKKLIGLKNLEPNSITGGNISTEQINEFEKSIYDKFPNDLLEEQQLTSTGEYSGFVAEGSGELKPDRLMSEIGISLFAAQSAPELRELMFNLAEAKSRHLHETIVMWDNEHEGWEVNFFEALKDSENDHFQNYKRAAELYREIMKESQKIGDELENRINKIV